MERCAMGSAGVWSLLLILTLVSLVGHAQNNNKPVTSKIFMLDSNRDCNGPVREIYKQTATVRGHGTIQEEQSPTSCTLTLKSTSNFQHTKLLLQVVAANINDCSVNLALYDGDPGQGLLRGYDCRTPKKPNERDFVTTGDVASFVMSRENIYSSQFDVEILVTPLDGGTKPNNNDDYGGTWGFFREKLENDIAIGIVAATFLLVIIIAVIIVVVCYRRYLGKNKPWEQHQLTTFRSPQSIYETKSKMSDTSSDVWTSNVSRGRVDPPRRRIEPNGRMARPSEDEDSVFDDASDIAPKKYLMEQDRQAERRRERERERGRGRGARDLGSQNSSYADDDHPQDSYEERIIEPRVRHGRRHKPPSYNEAINDSETERSEDDEDDDDDMDKKGSSEEEEESEEPSSEEEEEEEEEDGNAVAPKPAPRSRANPPPSNAVPIQPGMPPPHAAYPPGYPPMGYMGGYPMAPGGQFVPLVAAPPPGQQPYPGVGPGHPPPGYPGPRPAGSVRPTDPPIYSYLVQRGYTPLDRGEGGGEGGGGSRHDTSQSGASGDDGDRSALASGVDYMRR